MNNSELLYWLKDAKIHRYAIGAFNANNLEQVQAIAIAAEAEQAPVILQASHNCLRYLGRENTVLGLQYFYAMAKVAADSVNFPFFIHLDHGTYNEVLWAIGLGFDSVMFDGGDLPFDENIRQTRELSEIAHRSDICIEAELGEVPKPGGTVSEEVGELTNPEKVNAFVQSTGIDSLAIAIGSVHGGKEKRVRLDLPLLQKIADQVDIPLVLHGSSGVLDEDIIESIKYGICKVNTATQSNVAFSRANQEYLQTYPDTADPRKYLRLAREKMTQAVRERIQSIGAAGKAAK